MRKLIASLMTNFVRFPWIILSVLNDVPRKLDFSVLLNVKLFITLSSILSLFWET